MARAPKPRSLREAYTDSNKWDRFYALMGGAEPQSQQVIAPKREYAKRQESEGSEKNVLKRVRAALRKHPNVAFCWREQSGLFGTVAVGFVGKPDLIGMLRNGRFFALEIKNARGGIKSEDQAYYLALIQSFGGLAGFASSVEDALAIIEGK